MNVRRQIVAGLLLAALLAGLIAGLQSHAIYSEQLWTPLDQLREPEALSFQGAVRFAGRMDAYRDRLRAPPLNKGALDDLVAEIVP